MQGLRSEAANALMDVRADVRRRWPGVLRVMQASPELSYEAAAILWWRSALNRGPRRGEGFPDGMVGVQEVATHAQWQARDRVIRSGEHGVHLPDAPTWNRAHPDSSTAYFRADQTRPLASIPTVVIGENTRDVRSARVVPEHMLRQVAAKLTDTQLAEGQDSAALARALATRLLDGLQRPDDAPPSPAAARGLVVESVVALLTAEDETGVDQLVGPLTDTLQDSAGWVEPNDVRTVLRDVHAVHSRLRMLCDLQAQADAQARIDEATRARAAQQIAAQQDTQRQSVAVRSSAASSTASADVAVSPQTVQRLREVNQAAAAWFAGQLADTDEARDYLGARGVDTAAWGAGWAPQAWTGLVEHLRAHPGQFTDDELLDAGVATLVRQGANAGRLVDRFRGRIMLPLHDGDSRGPVGFVGRVLPRLADEATPKYLNTPTTALFRKSAYLYGLAQGTAALGRGAVPVVVEGPFDAIAVTQASGGRHVGMAPLGTALTEAHLQSLDQVASGARLMFALDADLAGRVATVRAWPLVASRDPQAVALPDGLDPAALVAQHGAAGWLQATTAVRPLIAHLLDDVTTQARPYLESAEGVVIAIRAGAELIAELPADRRPDAITHLASVIEDTIATVRHTAGQPFTPNVAYQAEQIRRLVGDRTTAHGPGTADQAVTEIDPMLDIPILDIPTDDVPVHDAIQDSVTQDSVTQDAAAADARKADARKEGTPDEPVRSQSTDVLRDVPAQQAGAAAGPAGVLHAAGGGDLRGDRATVAGPGGGGQGAAGDVHPGAGAGEQRPAAGRSPGDAGDGVRAGAGAGDAGPRTAGRSAGPGAPAVAAATPDTATSTPDATVGEAAGVVARFRPATQDDLAPAGKRAKAVANLAAVRLMRQLRDAGRGATVDEQQVLARWSGWGALPEVFERRPGFEAVHDELRALLDEQAWREAEANTLNAHYTDAALVEAIWQAVTDLGVTSGSVLEPGSGIGTFIALAPEGVDMVGVELDRTTAAISQLLHPHATVHHVPFERARLPEGAFVAAVGNVPFGKIPFVDARHNPAGYSIHDAFITKTLNLVAPGGTVAVITSRFSLDGGGKNQQARREWAGKADLLGAVRLPEAAHQRAAGTDVVTDVLVFRTLDSPDGAAAPGRDLSWVDTVPMVIDGSPVEVSGYFAAHPDRVLGEQRLQRGMYSDGEYTVVGPREAAPALRAALTAIVREASDRGLHDAGARARAAVADLARAHQATDAGASGWDGAEEDRPEGHIAESERVFERTVTHTAAGAPLARPRTERTTFTQVEQGLARPLYVPATQQEEIRHLVELRDATLALLDAEAASTSDTAEIAQLRTELNQRYEYYAAAYGPLNRFTWGSQTRTDRESGEKVTTAVRQNPPAVARFRSDPSSAVVWALEDYDPATGQARTTDIMRRRVVAERTPPTSVDSPADALAIVQDQLGQPDLAAIARLLDVTEPVARAGLGTLVFDEPGTGRLVPRAEYLSGDVRAKLVAAQAAAVEDARFHPNIAALLDVVPRDLGPGEIHARLGASWIDVGDVQVFVRELTEDSRATVTKALREWKVTGVSSGGSSPATTTWGTPRRDAFDLAEALLNGRAISVTDEVELSEGGTRRVKNPGETIAAQAKADAIKERFATWVWEDPERAERLAGIYNTRFNNLVLRSYDGAQLLLPGLTAEWTMRPHQLAAVARIVAEPTALLAHEVGAGKTAEMVAGAMELRRLGLARKPAMVVPNHMLEQFSREFLQLYPQAKILAAGSGDLTGDRRRLFVARAATGDWDAVILTQGAFKAIPMSAEAREEYMRRHLDEVRDAVESAAALGERDSPTFKQLQRMLKSEEGRFLTRLARLRQDRGGVTWEQTGIDYLFVDEAHHYKNLALPTNDASMAVEGSDRAADLDMKLSYLRERSASGRVATFATATPVANSMGELYIVNRYLRPDLLQGAGIGSFDEWIATFAEKVTRTEMSVDGGFKQKTRFSSFINAPELIRVFRTFADVKTAADLGLPVPEIVGTPDAPGETENVVAESSPELADFIFQLGQRAQGVANGHVDPTVDNMLKISSDGRKAALDMRLVGGHGGGKIDLAADRIAAIYEENKARIYKVRAGAEQDSDIPGALQIVFCDLGTPGPGWNVYDELKAQLVARGVPGELVRYVHEARNDAEKAELFAAARAGKVAVLVGSTEKMGVGTNAQNRAIALHHLDAPWRPADVTQRDGRLVRQGNQHPQVRIFRYLTEGSFDGFMWQTLQRKAKFIAQAMSGDLTQREIEDIGDAELSAAQAMALASGNPLLLEKADVEADLQKLLRLEQAHTAEQRTFRSSITYSDADAAHAAQHAQQLQRAIAARTRIDGAHFALTLGGRTHVKRPEAAAALRAHLEQIMAAHRLGTADPVEIGQFGGHTITAQAYMNFDGSKGISVGFRDIPYSATSYSLDDLATAHLLIRLGNRLADLEGHLAGAEDSARRAQAAAQRARDNLGTPFAHADRLATLRTRATALTRLLAAQEDQSEKGQGLIQALTRAYEQARTADLDPANAPPPAQRPPQPPHQRPQVPTPGPESTPSAEDRTVPERASSTTTAQEDTPTPAAPAPDTADTLDLPPTREEPTPTTPTAIDTAPTTASTDTPVTDRSRLTGTRVDGASDTATPPTSPLQALPPGDSTIPDDPASAAGASESSPTDVTQPPQTDRTPAADAALPDDSPPAGEARTDQAPPQTGTSTEPSGQDQQDQHDQEGEPVSTPTTAAAPGIIPDQQPRLIVIEHTATGSLTFGTTRGDTDVQQALRDTGWRWSRNIGDEGAWYLPRNMRPETRDTRVDRLEARLRALGRMIERQNSDAWRTTAQEPADHRAATSTTGTPATPQTGTSQPTEPPREEQPGSQPTPAPTTPAPVDTLAPAATDGVGEQTMLDLTQVGPSTPAAPPSVAEPVVAEPTAGTAAVAATQAPPDPGHQPAPDTIPIPFPAVEAVTTASTADSTVEAEPAAPDAWARPMTPEEIAAARARMEAETASTAGPMTPSQIATARERMEAETASATSQAPQVLTGVDLHEQLLLRMGLIEDDVARLRAGLASAREDLDRVLFAVPEQTRGRRRCSAAIRAWDVGMDYLGATVQAVAAGIGEAVVIGAREIAGPEWERIGRVWQQMRQTWVTARDGAVRAGADALQPWGVQLCTATARAARTIADLADRWAVNLERTGQSGSWAHRAARTLHTVAQHVAAHLHPRPEATAPIPSFAQDRTARPDQLAGYPGTGTTTDAGTPPTRDPAAAATSVTPDPAADRDAARMAAAIRLAATPASRHRPAEQAPRTVATPTSPAAQDPWEKAIGDLETLRTRMQARFDALDQALSAPTSRMTTARPGHLAEDWAAAQSPAHTAAARR